MTAIWKKISWLGEIVAGSTLFALGFAVFLMPNEINTGGISGLSMLLVHLLGFGSVGTFTIALNVPLFLIGGLKIGKRFFAGSLIGMLLSSALIDAFSVMGFTAPDPLIGGLYGGVVCGLGLGLVFSAGGSTGGSDILVRLMKRRYRNVPIGQISFCIDAMVVILTGLVFHDPSKAMYSGVVVFISGRVMDAVVYRFDYSKVALIVSDRHEEITAAISQQLERGATYLNGEGSYTGKQTKVVLSVVSTRQLAELKEVVMEVDPYAFVIFLEAHQVLGDGFGRYSRDSL